MSALEKPSLGPLGPVSPVCPGEPLSPFGPGEPLVPAGPAGPCGPRGPDGNWPRLKSFLRSDPFFTATEVTLFLWSCFAPTLFLGSETAYDVPLSARKSAR